MRKGLPAERNWPAKRLRASSDATAAGLPVPPDCDSKCPPGPPFTLARALLSTGNATRTPQSAEENLLLQKDCQKISQPSRPEHTHYGQQDHINGCRTVPMSLQKGRRLSTLPFRRTPAGGLGVRPHRVFHSHPEEEEEVAGEQTKQYVYLLLHLQGHTYNAYKCTCIDTDMYIFVCIY